MQKKHFTSKKFRGLSIYTTFTESLQTQTISQKSKTILANANSTSNKCMSIKCTNPLVPLID